MLPVERNPRHSTYNWGGAAQPKVTVLTVMCQQESRPEIQAGTLFTQAQPLSLPAVPRYYSQFSFDQMLFPFLSAIKKPARDGVFTAGLYERKKKEKKNVKEKGEEHANAPKGYSGPEPDSKLEPFYCGSHCSIREFFIV